jgi:hypothetical protein
MNTEPISSTPIQEVRDTMLNPAYFPQFREYLENECGCCCTSLDETTALIRFPEGTMEEEYANLSTAYKRETIIRLPNGIKLVKRVYPSSEEKPPLVALLLPKDANRGEKVKREK